MGLYIWQAKQDSDNIVDFTIVFNIQRQDLETVQWLRVEA